MFAAIGLTEGKLIGTCMSQHRHQEWIKFLKPIDAETPAELESADFRACQNFGPLYRRA